MKIIRFFSFTFLFASLSACVSFPNTPAFDLPAGSKVAYDIFLDEDIAHTHYGTTVFNNFERIQKGENWGLNEFAKSEAQRLIKLHGFVPIEIDHAEIFGDIAELPENPNQTQLQEHLDQRLTKLSQAGIDAVFTLKTHRNMVAMECSNFGCAEFYAEAPGFYSRGLVLLPPFLHAVLPSSNSSYIVEPYAPISNLKGRYGRYDSQLKHMKGFKPEKFKAMTKEEWALVESSLKELITEITANNIRSIHAGADGEGGYLREVP